MGTPRTDMKTEWERKTNQKSRDKAKRHRNYWSDAEVERIMDDDVLVYDQRSFPGRKQINLATELGRTWAAIKDKRHEVKKDLEKELENYDGPIIPTDEWNAEQEKNYKAALRKVCISMTSWSMRNTKEAVGSEDHQFELLEMYSMLGLMDDEP